MRVLGLDVGEKWVGVALSDPGGILASPLTVLERKGGPADIEALIALVQEYGVEEVVVGLPLTLKGEMGSQGQKAQAFMAELARRAQAPVIPWDERFSTVAAAGLLTQARRKKAVRRARQDDVAAAFILQGYLDAHRLNRGGKGRAEG